MFANKKARVGYVWEGPVAYSDDYAAVPRPGYYALNEDGKDFLKPLMRVVCVDDAPGNRNDGACHYEVASDTDPVQKRNDGVPVYVGDVTELEVDLVGSSEVGT